MAVVEPILQENKDRFVIFPYQTSRYLGMVQKTRSVYLDSRRNRFTYRFK
jgi:hypothetical protein